MITQSSLMEELREIENVTDVNGCFLLRIRDNSIVESTIPVRIADDILWEIPVLKETFQQFADSVNHGHMDQLTLEGEKGFIFMYNLSPDFILLTLSGEKIHLAYHTLGMLDILDRIKTKLGQIGEDLLLAPAQVFIGVGEDSKKFVPKLVTAESADAKVTPKVAQPVKAPVKITAPSPVKATSSAVTPSVAKPVKVIAEAKSPVAQNTASAVKLTPRPAATAVSTKGFQGIMDMINNLSGKEEKHRKQLLASIFSELKSQVSSMTGVQIADALDALKDKFLEFIGASVALFDISRSARDIRKIQDLIPADEAGTLASRIDNWASRLIK